MLLTDLYPYNTFDLCSNRLPIRRYQILLCLFILVVCYICYYISFTGYLLYESWYTVLVFIL